ncbi:diacylglycerol/lipid kinase family protein [Luethyella okanaganae]|uniref:Diacylglycerol/lipid kinase family protein n=1 Tax=Luethyella okanaganae TaxID=69372 RepID=A0ABW1VEJ2_9MICO
MAASIGREKANTAPRAAVVFNPTKSGIAELRAAMRAAERKLGWAASEWFETTVDDPGKGMARQAVTDGFDLVLAAGGDGTVRSVAAALRGSGVPLGIVPAGTGNLFARNLGIPVNDADSAAAVALGGIDRAVDLSTVELTRPDGSIEDHVSLVMSGVGIDAAMISNTNPELKKRVGWLAYVDAGLRSLPTSKPFRIHYRMDDHGTHGAHVSSILVANLGYLPGNIELIPDAEVDDGKLDVVVLQPKGVWGWLTIWRRVTWENRVLRKSAIGQQWIDLTGGDKRSAITYLRGTSVSIRIEGDPEEFELDGDEFGVVTAVEFTTDAASLLVRVPPQDG